MQLFHFWLRDVHPVQNLLLCTKFHLNRMTLSWSWYNDFQNGGRPPSWNCFTIIQDHTRSLCCWPQLPVKFHVNLIHRSEDSYLNFSYIWLEMPIQAPKIKVLGDFGPLNVIIRSRPPKGTSLRKSASAKLSTVKIRWAVWPVGELTKGVTDTQIDTHTHRLTHIGKFIFCPCIALDGQ